MILMSPSATQVIVPPFFLALQGGDPGRDTQDKEMVQDLLVQKSERKNIQSQVEEKSHLENSNQQESQRDRSLHYTFDHLTGERLVTLLDDQTGKVIRWLPLKEENKFAALTEKLKGLLVNVYS